MRTKKLFAILLACVMSLAMICGSSVALATEEQPAATAQDTAGPEITPAPEVTIEAPVVIVAETPAVAAETSDPTSEPESTDTPADPTETPADPMETPADPTETPADPTEVPADPTETPADPTEVPADPTEVPADPTEVPADPTEVPVVYSDRYATVEGGTAVYAEKALKTLLGEFTEDQVMFIADVVELENGAICEAHFDTEETVGTDAGLVGYFYAADLQFLTETEAEIETAVLASVRTESGDKLPVAKFRAVPKPEPTAEPEGAYINAETVNVRAEASAESEPVTQLAKGATIVALQAVQNELGETWYLIAYDGGEGYVRSDFVANVDLVAPEATEAPEATDAPAAEEPAETRSLAEIIDETNPDRSITVDVAWDTETPELGSTATLTMNLIGYDGLTYTVFWQCDKGDGWETVHEGTPSISFMVCEENVNWQWRAGVTITAAPEVPAETPAEEPVAEATAAE